MCSENPTCISRRSGEEMPIALSNAEKKQWRKEISNSEKNCEKYKTGSKYSDYKKSCISDLKCMLDSDSNCPFDLPPTIMPDDRTGEKKDIESSLKQTKLWKKLYSHYDDRYRNVGKKLMDKTKVTSSQENVIYSIVTENQSSGVQ